MTQSRLVVVVSAVALTLAACGSPSTAAQTEDNPPTSTTNGVSGGVHVASSEHGDILVGPDGNSLYVFTADSGDVSACTGACLESWPALTADTVVEPDLDKTMFGAITREDGFEQMTVNGMPLYYYAGDTGPGDTAGQGLNDSWFVVDPSGVMVEVEDTEDTIIDYDY